MDGRPPTTTSWSSPRRTPRTSPLATAALEAGLPVVLDKPMAASASDAEAVLAAAHTAGPAAQRLPEPAVGRRLPHRPTPGRRRRRRTGRPLRVPLRAVAPRARPERLARARRPGRGGRAAPRPRQPPRRPGDAALRAPDPGLRRGRPAPRRAPRSTTTPSSPSNTRAASGATCGSASRPAWSDRGSACWGCGAPSRSTASTPRRTRSASGADPSAPGWGSEPEDRWGTLADVDGERRIETEPGDYPAYYAGVAAALRDGGRPPVDPQDSIIGLRVLEAARQSAARGTVEVLEANPTDNDPRRAT